MSGVGNDFESGVRRQHRHATCQCNELLVSGASDNEQRLRK
jgi:hypothetical protein